jgi:hypothetical protein
VVILKVESAQKTHIPIVVPFVHIGEIWVAILLLHTKRGCDLCQASSLRDELARHSWHGSRCCM